MLGIAKDFCLYFIGFGIAAFALVLLGASYVPAIGTMLHNMLGNVLLMHLISWALMTAGSCGVVATFLLRSPLLRLVALATAFALVIVGVYTYDSVNWLVNEIGQHNAQLAYVFALAAGAALSFVLSIVIPSRLGSAEHA